MFHRRASLVERSLKLFQTMHLMVGAEYAFGGSGIISGDMQTTAAGEILLQASNLSLLLLHVQSAFTIELVG
jgi:hypothetical protein